MKRDSTLAPIFSRACCNGFRSAGGNETQALTSARARGCGWKRCSGLRSAGGNEAQEQHGAINAEMSLQRPPECWPLRPVAAVSGVLVLVGMKLLVVFAGGLYCGCCSGLRSAGGNETQFLCVHSFYLHSLKRPRIVAAASGVLARGGTKPLCPRSVPFGFPKADSRF